jgi:peptidoglycan/LPS O-acetylase OafA/YrhL
MKSSTGAYFVGLDQIRCVAALLVFEWHFLHGNWDAPSEAIPTGHPPLIFPFAIVDEGHCGVALFMCLSGYLFAKLLDGSKIRYASFLWNRFLRLAPLLLLTVTIEGAWHHAGLFGFPSDLRNYTISLIQGVVLPTLPNGAWSITAEAHFYIMLPWILLITRPRPSNCILIIAAAITLRILIFYFAGEVENAAYFTIVGRIDQFVLGVAAFQSREIFRGKHEQVFWSFLAFSAFYWYFASLGGERGTPEYPSQSPIWIILPTAEALFFSMLIAYYDTTFKPSETGISGLIAKAGAYSYSIYLLHSFYVFKMSATFAGLFPNAGFYLTALVGVIIFAGAGLAGHYTFRYIERPFLRFRKPYIIQTQQPP